jgi:hypothetical protein
MIHPTNTQPGITNCPICIALPMVTPMHRSILFLNAKITALTCSAILEKKGMIIADMNTSLIGDLAANPSIVSTIISLNKDMTTVTMPSQTNPIRIDIISVLSNRESIINWMSD